MSASLMEKLAIRPAKPKSQKPIIVNAPLGKPDKVIADKTGVAIQGVKIVDYSAQPENEYAKLMGKIAASRKMKVETSLHVPDFSIKPAVQPVLPIKPKVDAVKVKRMTLVDEQHVIPETTEIVEDEPEIVEPLIKPQGEDVVIEPTPVKKIKIVLKRPVTKKEEPIEEAKEAIEEAIEEEKVEEKPVAKKVTIRKPKVIKKLDKRMVPEGMVKVTDKDLLARLPKLEAVNLKVSSFFLDNRENFTNFVNNMFADYKEELDNAESQLSCDARDGDFSLLTHQKIVRDYLSYYTPYRGLLIYHGLGSGKTCSAIAIAEGLKTHRHVTIMTPASLRPNFIGELKKCGDALYKKTQYWEFIDTKKNPQLIEQFALAMSLTREFINKQGGVWFVDVTKPANFEKLTSEQKANLDVQLNEMIDMKYRFINYNGLNNAAYNRMTEDGAKNPFDNEVVIIDEAHNFVSRIVNKLRTKSALSMRLYENLLSAKNCRVVMLSGTPIINYPNEIAIMFNIIRGYINTWNFTLNVVDNKKVDNASITRLLNKEISQADYIDYKPSTKRLAITRNPYGFVNRLYYNKPTGVALDDKGDISDDDFVKAVVDVLSKAGIKVVEGGIEVERFKALPDKYDDFKQYFINVENGEMKNINIFKRRILGMTSFFRSAQEQLMPRFDRERDMHVVKIPMSDYQFGLYETVRSQERKLEKENAKKRNKQNNMVDNVYSDSVSTYRIFSRAFCNFVFPEEIPRPFPKDTETVENFASVAMDNIDEDAIDAVPAEQRVNNVDGLYSGDDIQEIKKEIGEMTDASYDQRIKNALAQLAKNADKYLTEEGLAKLSPKFNAILDNIMNPENDGLHLIYSQFRTIEGIGVLKLVMDANGFEEFRLVKGADGEYAVAGGIEALKGKPKYVLYTGTEDVAYKELVRNIYNGDWNLIPNGIATMLREVANDNKYGTIIKVFMITASGAEGISLKNTRFVHLTEPYWHPVRTEQVIGRARRICSHMALPEEKRTVEVFLYLMTFTEAQLNDDKTIELKLIDRSKLDNVTPLSSDEALYEIATIKENITNQVLRNVKESSIDCAFHSGKNAKEPLVCFNFANPNKDKFAYKPDIGAETTDKVAEINQVKVTWKAQKINIAGKDYAFRPDTQQIYDFESYIKATREAGNVPILIGTLEKDITGKGYQIKYI